MKTLVPVVLGSVLGFVAVFACVPRREAEQLPPTWFELPGRPLRVDGKPTRTWQEVNDALRGATQHFLRADEFVSGLGTSQLELEGPRVTVEYVPSGRGGSMWAGAEEATAVTLRPVFPRAVPWSRARQDDLIRYEVERPVGVD